jgi:tetratricopeptide (TPR) repeat protein
LELTSISFSIILRHRPTFRIIVPQVLSGQLVAIAGKLSSLGRKDARALVERLGGVIGDDVNAKTTILVVGAAWSGAPDEERLPVRDKSPKLRRAEELNVQQPGAVRILSEDEFCRLTGVPAPSDLRQQYYGERDLLARYRALREDHLRYLVKCGVLRPVTRTPAEAFFSFQDVAIVKQANDELAEGVPFRSLVKALLAEREGQLSFDFRLDAEPARIITLEGRRTPSAPAARRHMPTPNNVRRTELAEEYFKAASSLDDGDESTTAEAAATYRKALELDPYLVAALINLANIHYSRDELIEAQALYEQAIGIEPDYFEAHFNLGNIHHDLGRFPEAQTCYREALRLNPTYADAHFYLAVTFEKLGMSPEARPHWSAYRQLAPQGEWVELAQEFSD